MSSITLKNVPEELLERLRRRAAQHHRSLAKEMLFLLDQGAVPPLVEQWTEARESTPAYGGRGPGASEPSPDEAKRLQLEQWRELCGQWESIESPREEIAAITAARTEGREVEL